MPLPLHQKKECGMQFKWSSFGLTSADAMMVGDCVKYSAALSHLAITERC